MLFVKSDALRAGMRLAKPIYNRNGVLLYERNTKLTSQGIDSVKNFGLIGLYILEPAEPVPPMSDADVEFERFQTMSVFSIKEDMNFMLRGRAPKNLNILCNSIAKNYGNVSGRVNFTQNLRSSEDYVYKHAINMGILVALMSSKMNLSYVEQMEIITAGLVHDIGKINLPYEIKIKYGEYTDEDLKVVNKCLTEGLEALRPEFNISQGVKRIITQFFGIEYQKKETDKLLTGTKIMLVADAFDTMTAMQLQIEPTSTLAAIKEMLANDDYDKEVVSALVASLDILYPGVCIELTNKQTALVIKANQADVLRPVVLDFQTNHIYDLSVPSTYKEVQISDIMRTMDNRIKVDPERLKEYIGK